MLASEAIQKRKLCRKFLKKPVALALVREILDVSRWAPSGGNTQPWHVYVVSGTVKREITALVAEQLQGGTFSEAPEFLVYPPKGSPQPAEYLKRRRALGYAMYSLMGIERGDKAGRFAAMAENWNFFGAPVGLIVTTDRCVDRCVPPRFLCSSRLLPTPPPV